MRNKDALALASRRIDPRKLLDAGYSFRFPDLETALRHELAELLEGQPEHVIW